MLLYLLLDSNNYASHGKKIKLKLLLKLKLKLKNKNKNLSKKNIVQTIKKKDPKVLKNKKKEK